MWNNCLRVLKKLMSRISKKFSGFDPGEFLFRMTSRKLWVILAFAAVAYFLNEHGRLTQAMADVLVGLSLAYCGSNIMQRKMEKK